MTKREQTAFVKNHAAAFTAELVLKIKAGKVPLAWDGHELRVWFADKVDRDAACSLIRRDPRSARARSYRNTIITTDL